MTTPGIANKVEAHYRRNFVLNIIEGAVYFFGLNISSFSTILPAYVKHFTESDIIIGLITTAMMLGFSLPQILASHHTRHVERKKRFIMVVSIPQRIPWFLLAVTTFAFAGGDSKTVLVLFFAGFTTYALSTGILIPSWVEFIAAIIPQEKRGRLFGYRNFLASGIGVFAAALANRILARMPFPTGFAVCFLLTFLFCSLSLPALALCREAPYPRTKDNGGLGKYFQSLPRILATDRNYSKYVITSIIITFHTMINAFFTVYAIEKLQVNDAQVAVFTGVLLGSQCISNIFLGYLADKKGHKSTMAMATLLGSIAAIIAILANSAFTYYGAFIFLGFSYSARMVSFYNILLEFAPDEQRGTYISLTNTILAPFTSISPILGGYIADTKGYKSLFILAVCIGIVALFMLLFWVAEPRKHQKLPTDSSGDGNK